MSTAETPTDAATEAPPAPPAAPAPTTNGGSSDLLIEVDGRLVPNYDATIKPFDEGRSFGRQNGAACCIDGGQGRES